MRQQHRHGKTVGNAVQAAQSVTDGMDIAHTATGEGTSCIEGTPLHILPGFQIGAILEGFEKAGVEDKVQLHIGDCKETLVRLRSEMGLGEDSGDVDTSKMYDIVYIDANKREYCEYYDLVFDMVRPGGLILADNVIWDGKVCMDPLPQDKQTLEIVRFNDKVTADPRVESVILPLRDGLNVIRKK